MTAANNLLALDVGERRVGIAIASPLARLPRPLTVLERGDNFWETLKKIVDDEQVGEIVIGLPRSMAGATTPQTEYVETFAEDLKQRLRLPVHFQDETLSSVRAETELGTQKKPYQKGEIDQLAATYILEDYLAQ